MQVSDELASTRNTNAAARLPVSDHRSAGRRWKEPANDADTSAVALGLALWISPPDVRSDFGHQPSASPPAAAAVGLGEHGAVERPRAEPTGSGGPVRRAAVPRRLGPGHRPRLIAGPRVASRVTLLAPCHASRGISQTHASSRAGPPPRRKRVIRCAAPGPGPRPSAVPKGERVERARHAAVPGSPDNRGARAGRYRRQLAGAAHIGAGHGCPGSAVFPDTPAA